MTNNDSPMGIEYDGVDDIINIKDNDKIFNIPIATYSKRKGLLVKILGQTIYKLNGITMKKWRGAYYIFGVS